MMKIILLFLLVTTSLSLFSQRKYNISIPNESNYQAYCGACDDFLRNKPENVLMALRVNKYNDIELTINDSAWFMQLFEYSTDAIAADIVLKHTFNCSNEKGPRNYSIHDNYFLKPIRKADLLETIQSTTNGRIKIKLGKLPPILKNENYEINVAFINKNKLCRYNTFINIQSYFWEIIDMGLYADTIIYQAKVDTSANISKKQTYSKKWKFIIPFEKNKVEYSVEDIKPLYDSLELNRFIIKSISIRAYASVEGSTKHNLKLQKGRAQSIIKALQLLQNEHIKQEISTSENWMEFYEEVKETEYDYLADKTKQEIKKLLSNKDFAEEMEFILIHQRKGVIEIEFEKRFQLFDATPDELVSEFENAIKLKNIETANKIQQYSFSLINNDKLPTSFITRLSIPYKKEYVLLINSKIVYQYFTGIISIEDAFKSFERLKLLNANSIEINYNYTALKLILWKQEKKDVDHRKFKGEIINLLDLDIDKTLIYRMLANYYFIITDIYFNNNDSENVNRVLSIIHNKYKSANLDLSGLLGVAQYFAYYTKFAWARETIEPYVTEIDVDEDILYYYINLTIENLEITERKEYQQILLNAIDINKTRFCNLFKPINKGGISFQLLEDKYLKTNYCQSCIDTD